MGNNNLDRKIIQNVRNRIVVSNLESEENMRINKRKQVLSLSIVMLIMVAGSFFTVNAATNGEALNQVKNSIKVIFIKEDGKEEEVKGNTYTDANNHLIEKYEFENNGAKHSLEVDKTILDNENLTITDTMKDDTISINIENK